MYYLNYIKLGNKEGGIRYDAQSNSYIVWTRVCNEKYQDCIPAYGDGVSAQRRLDDEMLKDEE